MYVLHTSSLVFLFFHYLPEVNANIYKVANVRLSGTYKRWLWFPFGTKMTLLSISVILCGCGNISQFLLVYSFLTFTSKFVITSKYVDNLVTFSETTINTKDKKIWEIKKSIHFLNGIIMLQILTIKTFNWSKLYILLLIFLMKSLC